MYGNHDTLQRILVLADVYFRLTGKSAGAMSGEEMEEFYAYTAQCSAPEELHNLIKIKINPGKDSTEGAGNFHAGGWSMLPPAQRIL